MKPLLQSILDDLKRLIRRDEGTFAELVIADLDEALERSTDQLKTAYKWLSTYKSLPY